MTLGFPTFDQALAIVRNADWDGLDELQTMLDMQRKIKALEDTIQGKERNLLGWRDQMFEQSKTD